MVEATIGMEPPGSRWREMDEAALWAQCRWEAFRASGPGGQKRNKTSSAVRVTHEPSGVHAIASESRSQQENRGRALRRVRHRLALEFRRPVVLEGFSPPGWWAEVVPGGRPRMSLRNARYPEALGLVLDVLCASGWSVSEAAAALGCSTGGLVRFLEADPKLWGEVNRRRAQAGLRALRG